MRTLWWCAVAAAVIAGCGSVKTTTVSSGQVTQLQTRAQKQAQALVQRCVSKGNFLTHAGRQAVIKCIAPPGHAKEFEACAQTAVERNVGVTGINEPGALAALATCAEKNR